MVDILDFKTKKERLKELAKKSLVFSVSDNALNDFITEVDKINEDDKGVESINNLSNLFIGEKESVIEKYKEILAE